MGKSISWFLRKTSLVICCVIALSVSYRPVAADDFSFDDLFLDDVPAQTDDSSDDFSFDDLFADDTPAKPIESEQAAPIDVNLDDLFLDTPTGQTPINQESPASENALDIDDFEFDFGPEDFIPATPPTPEPSASSTPIGLELDLPLVGAVKLVPFVEERTKKSGLKAQFADASRKISFGALTIDSGEIHIIDGAMGITGRATLFGKHARFGAKEIRFGGKTTVDGKEKSHVVRKLTLGFTFINKPTLTLFGDNAIVFEEADLVLERNQPLIMQTLTTLFSQQLIMGFAITKLHTSAFLHVPPLTPLQELFPQVKETALDAALIKQAELTINNIYRSANAPTKDAERALTIKGFIDLNNPELLDEPQTKKDDSISFKGLKFNGSLSKKGALIVLHAQKFPLHNFGTIGNATLTFDSAKDFLLHLTGTWDAAIPSVTPFTAQVTSSLSKKGVTLSGQTTTPLIYAGVTINHVKVHFSSEDKQNLPKKDDEKKQSDEEKKEKEDESTQKDEDARDENPNILLTGDMIHENLTLKALLSVAKNPITKQQSVTFSAQSTVKEFRPFADTPGLEPFKITDLNAHIATKRIDGKQQHTLELNGYTHIFGGTLYSTISFVKGENGQSGVFVEIPLSEEEKVTDAAPDLTMLDGLDLRQVRFQLSTIDFTEPVTNRKIKKGLSLSAKVPLTGPLKPIGQSLGTSGQMFELEGTVVPQAPRNSSFSVILSRGTPDITKSMTINEIRLVIGAGGTIETLADLTVRPDPTNKPNESYTFTGTLEVGATSSAIKARMDGTIKDIFSTGADLKDTALELGLLNGNPTVPTRGGFTIELIWKDMTFYGYALVDWTKTPPILAFDIGVQPKDEHSKVSSTDLLNVIAGSIKKKLPEEFPKIDFYNLSGRFNSTFSTVTVGAKHIPPGIKFKANMDIFKRKGEAEFFIGCDDLFNCGIKAFGTIDPINVMDILIIKGHDAQTLRSKFPATAPSSASADQQNEFEQRKQEIIDSLVSNNQKPVIDVEFTLLRQKFLIDGILNLSVPLSNGRRFTLLESATFASLKTNSVLISTKGQIGGEEFSYINDKGEKVPVLLAEVSMYSDRGFDTPNFSLDIVFANYFNHFVRQQAEMAFNKAITEVETEISKAQQEIDKIDAVITKADAEILKAQADVEQARQSLVAIDKAINEVRIAFEEPRDDVESIKREINALHAWYESLTTAEQVLRSVDYGVRIAGMEIAYNTSLGVLNGSESIATRTLNASKLVAEQTLALATAFLNEVVRKASPAILKGSAQTAKGILEGAKQTSVGVIKATKKGTNLAIGGFQCTIDRAEFHGKLEDIKTGVLPSVILEGNILGEPFRFTIAIDVTKGMNGLKQVIEPIAREIANIPVKKARKVLNELTALFKPADRHADEIAKELASIHEPREIQENLEKLKNIEQEAERAKELARKAHEEIKAKNK